MQHHRQRGDDSPAALMICGPPAPDEGARSASGVRVAFGRETHQKARRGRRAVAAAVEDYRALLRGDAHVVQISALRSQGLDELTALLGSLLPVRPPEFEEDQITDLYEREIAADLIREAALLKLRDEVPHSIAVRLDEFSERPNGMAYIAATLLVERDSQKGIVIGEGGRMLKQIGTKAREEIQSMGGRQVYLQLRVKVEKDWRNNENVLRRLGYKLKQR